MADLNGLRDHAIIDADTSDSKLQLYLNAAKQYFKGSGVPEPAETNALYDLGVYELAAFYHDKRIPIGAEIDAEVVPFGISGIIHQLKESW